MLAARTPRPAALPRQRAAAIALALTWATVVSTAQAPAPAHQPPPPPAQPTIGPKIVLSQPNWDFGQAWEDEPQTLNLNIRNEGASPLILTNVRSTCGCTVAQPAKRELAPGETTSMNVRFDTHGKQGDVSSKVIIESSDIVTPKVEFAIKGFVKRAIVRNPLGGLVIRTRERAPGATAAVRLENQLAEPMKLELVQSTIPELDIRINEITPGVAYDVIGKTTGALPPGILRGDLTFRSGLSREGTFSIPVRIQTLGKIEPVPAAILLRVEDAAPVTRKVQLQYFGSDGVAGLRITEATSNNPAVRVTVGIARPPEAWMAKLTPPVTALVDADIASPGGKDLPAGGVQVTFKTSDAEMPEVVVDVTTDKSVFERRMYGRYSTGGAAKQ